MQTATAMRQEQDNRRLQIAMTRLFERLRHFVEARPIRQDDVMPDHDLVWVDKFRDGPAQTVLAAIRATPEMWASALPSECCIVHRETLEKYVGAGAAELMAEHGDNAVANQAARLLYEAEQREKALDEMRAATQCSHDFVHIRSLPVGGGEVAGCRKCRCRFTAWPTTVHYEEIVAAKMRSPNHPSQHHRP